MPTAYDAELRKFKVRRKKIVEAFEKIQNAAEVARKFGVSSTRIRKIIQEELARDGRQ